tara:strand:+ start:42 stop:377 length:336 start_codon:yes stop_codon:yes gene_type:complete
MANSNPKFKVGQAVSFPLTGIIGSRVRKGGTITKVERMYELKDEYKRYYPDGTCRGELTTDKDLSKRKFKGYAYRCKTIQPKGYTSEIVMVEEYKLNSSTREKIVKSYINS